MNFQPPSWHRPEDYNYIPKSIDDMFNAFYRAQANSRQAAQFEQNQQLTGLQMANARQQSAAQQVENTLKFGGVSPEQMMAPGVLQRAQQPAQMGNMGPNYGIAQPDQDPAVNQWRELLSRHKASRDQAAESGKLALDEKRASIGKLNAEADEKRAIAAGGGLGPSDRAKIEGQIMDDYMKSKTFANLAAAKSGLRDLASIQANKTGAADIAAIYSFVKTMDDNAVKEGEIALAQSALPGLDKVKIIYDNLKSGNKLTPELKKELLMVAKGMYESKLRSADEYRAPFVSRANQYKIDPNIAVPRLAIPDDEFNLMGGGQERTLEAIRADVASGKISREQGKAELKAGGF